MRTFWLLSAAALISLPAHADPARDALAAISRCADIASAAERLQCFDGAVSGAKTALAAPPPVQEAAAQTAELRFPVRARGRNVGGAGQGKP